MVEFPLLAMNECAKYAIINASWLLYLHSVHKHIRISFNQFKFKLSIIMRRSFFHDGVMWREGFKVD